MRERYIEDFKADIKNKSDRLMDYFLPGFFILGLLFAFYYETWLIAIAVGGLSLMDYYSAKFFLPASDLYQYILSTVFGIFMAQYIYQMHGMFEMHFFAFIGSTILVTNRNSCICTPRRVWLFAVYRGGGNTFYPAGLYVPSNIYHSCTIGNWYILFMRVMVLAF